MCGIFGLIENTSVNFNDQNQVKEKYKQIITNVTNILHKRGPDSYGNKLIIDPNFDKTVLMIHTRLRIVGDNTPQPIISKDQTKLLIINGEIFNWQSLQQELDYTCTQSDCEIIFPLYERYKHNIPEMLNRLIGQFSFMLYDLTNKHILIARDPIGVTPLYIGYKQKLNDNMIERFVVSSELKCLTMLETSNKDTHSFVDNIKIFYPRSYIYTSIDKPNNELFDSKSILTYTDFYEKYSVLPPAPNPKYKIRDHYLITEKIRRLLSNSVRKRLVDLIQDGVEFGVLLSGGLDSSIISSLVVSIADELDYDQKIKTFSIGVKEDVPDLIAARKVAEFLNTDHKEYYFSTQTGIDNLQNVIYSTESYDCTTIRASTPMYLLTKSIRNDFPNMKVLFSGELSDELLCYLYGANAPSQIDFQLETLNLVSNVHMFDCLRSNKMCMSHSFEVRVPFTDIDYVKYILSLHPQWKTFGPNSQNTIEKQILRDSFIGYLPKHILYRKKEQFSDGVSSLEDTENNWIECIKKYSDNLYSDLDFQSRKLNFVHNNPTTKEQLLYREIFCKLFNNTNHKNTSEFTVKTWEPKWSENKDPSGRVQTYWVEN
jgi:asparagine synthase (glutamine-hydrolysing)